MIGIYAILLIVLSGILYSDKNVICKKIYCFTSYFSMFLFAALRGPSVGLDNYNRYKDYIYISTLDFLDFYDYIIHSSKDIGYSMMIWLISLVAPNENLIAALLDFFVIFSFAYFFYKYSEDITVTTLFFFSFVFAASLNISRQYIAVALFLWVLDAIINNKTLKSIVFLLGANTFHTSSLLLWGGYLLKAVDFKINRLLASLLCLGSVSVYLFFAEVLEKVILTFFPMYEWYAFQSEWATGDRHVSFILFLVDISIVAIMYALVFYYDDKTKNIMHSLNRVADSKQKKLTSILFVCIVLYILISLLTEKLWFINRIGTYFIFAYCLTWGFMFNRISILFENNTHCFVAIRLIRLIFIFLVSVWCINMYKIDPHGLFPYMFFFE